MKLPLKHRHAIIDAMGIITQKGSAHIAYVSQCAFCYQYVWLHANGAIPTIEHLPTCTGKWLLDEDCKG